MTTPTTLPRQLIAGDTLACDLTFADYSPVDGWVLSFAFRNVKFAFDLPPVADPVVPFATSGNTFQVRVTAAVTAPWDPGTYNYQGYVTSGDGTERHLVLSGQLTIKPNLAAQQSYDSRSFNQRVLDNLKEIYEGRGDITEYQIQTPGGMRLVRKEEREILERAIAKFSWRVARERGDIAGMLKVRFVRG